MIDRVLDMIARLLSYLAAASMFTLMMLVFTSVFFRYVLNQPIIATEDMMAILLGVMIFTAIPSVTLERSHISVELLTAPIKKIPLLNRMRLIAVDIGVVAMTLYMAWLIYNQATRYFQRDTTSLVMEWPLFPYIFFFAGLLILGALLFLIRAIRDRGTVTKKGGISL